MPPSDDLMYFRRLCRDLGARGNSRQDHHCREQAWARLQKIPLPQRQDHLAATWQKEESGRRRRSLVVARFYGWGLLVAVGVFFLSLFWEIWRGKGSPVSLPFFPMVAYTVGALLSPRVGETSSTQRGAARLLLRQGATVADVGRLIDIQLFPPAGKEEYEEFAQAAIQQLTRLWPDIVQTDHVVLDEFQRTALRDWLVSITKTLTGRKPTLLQEKDADFVATLFALSSLGALRGTTRADQAARDAVQRLASAAPRPDEPLNHRYVRGIARESLAQVPAGNTR